MRNGFNFYKSYYDTAKELPEKECLQFLMAILERQFTGKHPDHLTGMAKLAYVSQKYNIDRQVAGYEDKTKQKLTPTVGGTEGGSVGGSQGPSVQVQEQVEEQGEEQGYIFSAEAEILKEDNFSVKANTENNGKKKKKTPPSPSDADTSTLHRDIIAAYEKFYEEKKGFKPQLLGSDFAGVKNLRTFFKRNNTPDDQALALFTAALNRYDEWGAFEKKQNKLNQICSNFQLIIDQLKNPNQHGKQTSKYTPDFSI